MSLNDSEIRINPNEVLHLTAKTPPFQSFFVSRILEPLKSKDRELVQRGQLLPETALSYEIISDNDEIKGLFIRNYGDERRLREIKSSLRWTLEKMYERISQP